MLCCMQEWRCSTDTGHVGEASDKHSTGELQAERSGGQTSPGHFETSHRRRRIYTGTDAIVRRARADRKPRRMAKSRTCEIMTFWCFSCVPRVGQQWTFANVKRKKKKKKKKKKIWLGLNWSPSKNVQCGSHGNRTGNYGNPCDRDPIVSSGHCQPQHTNGMSMSPWVWRKNREFPWELNFCKGLILEMMSYTWFDLATTSGLLRQRERFFSSMVAHLSINPTRCWATSLIWPTADVCSYH